jgi:hypothetical protein
MFQMLITSQKNREGYSKLLDIEFQYTIYNKRVSASLYHYRDRVNVVLHNIDTIQDRCTVLYISLHGMESMGQYRFYNTRSLHGPTYVHVS